MFYILCNQCSIAKSTCWIETAIAKSYDACIFDKSCGRNYAQYNNVGPKTTKSKNTNDILKICICVVVAVVILIGLVFGGYFVFTSIFKKDDNKTNEVVNESNVKNTIDNKERK